MFQFLNLDPDVFGMDINDLAVRAVKLRKRRGGFELVSYGQEDIAPDVVANGLIKNPQKLASAIGHLCKNVNGKPLNTRYAAVSLPEERSFYQVISMPQMSDRELAAALPYEVENYIPLPLEKVYLGFEAARPDTPSEPGKQRVLVSAITRSVVDAYVSCLERAGLVPYAMEGESQAIARALFVPQAAAPATICIDFGSAKTRIITVSSNTICSTALAPPSSDKVTMAIANDLKLPMEKARLYKIKNGLAKLRRQDAAATFAVLDDLVGYIKKYMTFYQDHVASQYHAGDASIERVVLAGGGANMRGLPEFLADALKLPVERGNPLVRLVPGAARTKTVIPARKQLSFATAIGLAIGAMDVTYD